MHFLLTDFDVVAQVSLSIPHYFMLFFYVVGVVSDSNLNTSEGKSDNQYSSDTYQYQFGFKIIF